MKSYLIMVKPDYTADVALVEASSEAHAKDALDYASGCYDVEWAVAYEFAGDEVRTVDHFERAGA
jgi:hypothetical protein